MEFSREGDKVLWEKIMILDLISSEESAVDEEEVLVVHPLPLRSSKVDAMFNRLDEYTKDCKSNQALCQTKKRCVGNSSTRNIPVNSLLPKWAVNVN